MSINIKENKEKHRCLNYELDFDLDIDNNPVNGKIIADSKKIIIKSESYNKSYNTDDFSEFSVDKQIGSANFNGVLNGKKTLLIKVTMANYEKFEELAKGLNYYLKSGDFVQLDYNQNICPKCKQPLFNNKECPYCQNKGKVLIRFIKMFKPFYPLLFASIITTLICQSFWIILPFFQRMAIDNYIIPKSSNISAFLLIIGSMILIQLIMTVAYRINAKFTNKVSNGIGKELRSMVFKKIQGLSLTSISKKTAGELINRINSDTSKIQDFISDFGPEMILRIISFIVVFVIIVFTNWKLAILVLVPMPIVFFFVSKLQEKIHVYYLNYWRKSAKANSILHDILSGIRIVKIFGSEKREIAKYTKVSQDYTAAQQRAELYWSYRMPFIDFSITIGQYLLLYFGSNLILQGTMQVGELIQLSSYVGMIYIPLRWLMYVRRSITNVGVSATKILEILDEEDGTINLDDNKQIKIQGDIEFKNVYFGYKKYEDVLKDVSFKIKKGEMIGIVGHSGVGKSTLINLILHLYDTTGGDILIDGIPINNIPQISLRNDIGVVLQETFLFYGSILDNIKYSKPDATFEEVMDAAKTANAHEFIMKLPDGYNTRVGERGYNLSGGERQRIAIARAILHNPSILILDEATASLDTKTEKDIQDALDKLIKGRTTFAIAHRLSTLRNADRLIVLDKGTVAEIGTHLELMKNKSVYYELVMAQRQTAKINK